MIVNLRGTHGAGKSTVIQRILCAFPHQVIMEPGGKKIWGYNVSLPLRKLVIVGPYHTACGGCDAIQPYSEIWPRVEEAYRDVGNVLFEGALISCSYGSIGLSSEKYGSNFVFATLDTPLDLCIARVNLRREAKGKLPLSDTKNIEGKFHSTRTSHQRAINEGRQVKMIAHEHPTRDVLKLFGVNIRKEPS